MKQLLRDAAAGAALSCLLLAGFPTDARADVRDDLHAAYAKMLGSRFVTETVATDQKGRQTRSRAEFDTIQRIRVSTDSGGFVILPEGTWMRSGTDGAWSKPPFDLGGMLGNLLPQSLDEMRAGTKNIRDEGMRSVDGVSLRAISYDVDTRIMGISVSSQTVAFIDSDGRIVRSESDGVAMGRKTRSVQTTRYDDSIRVSAPD